ncbi:MAG: carbohydrate porin [Melioribacteraceae bacterium]|nr:carbohydrate porin [Melioribacteraceae bacterium]MCF8356518.1 carbohydrate porin [Melioribacteraceae bacterium]MCF8420961.1 carbohydrate porin [Melioribacteraceae bacterium]
MYSLKITCFLLITLLTISTCFAQSVDSLENQSLINVGENSEKEDELYRVNPAYFWSLDYNELSLIGLHGSEQPKSYFSDMIDIQANVNFSDLIGNEKTNSLVRFWSMTGDDIANYSQVGQGVNYLAGPNYFTLAELWIDQTFLNRHASILAGLYDISSEFDVKETADIFINPSFGTGTDLAASSTFGPSIFPLTSLAVRAKYNFSSHSNLKLAFTLSKPGEYNFTYPNKEYDGSNEKMFFISEYQHDFSNLFLTLGTWFYNSTFTDFSNYAHHGNLGFYTIVERSFGGALFYEAGSFYLRFGTADPLVNRYDFFYSGAVRFEGLLSNEDNLGIGFSTVNSSKYYQYSHSGEVNCNSSVETVLELTYKYPLFEYLSMQPDLQYIVSPSNCIDNHDSFVFGLKISININKEALK